MPIEDVFNPRKDCPYLVDNIVSGKPQTVAGKVVVDFLEQNPRGIVWTFYQRLGLPIREAITVNGKQFDRCCYVGDFALFSKTVPEQNLFPDINLVYVQLCNGQPPQGIGFVKRERATEVGHYQF